MENLSQFIITPIPNGNLSISPKDKRRTTTAAEYNEKGTAKSISCGRVYSGSRAPSPNDTPPSLLPSSSATPGFYPSSPPSPNLNPVSLCFSRQRGEWSTRSIAPWGCYGRGTGTCVKLPWRPSSAAALSVQYRRSRLRPRPPTTPRSLPVSSQDQTTTVGSPPRDPEYQLSERKRWCRRESTSWADGFSTLPDDIITDYILARLNFKEKVQSSVLSRRWKHLWRYSLGTELLFHHGVNALSRAEWGVGHIQSYVRGVDSILKSFSGPKLDHLSISAGMGHEFSDVLHRWIRLAIQKGLQRLNLILAPSCLEESATFPSLNRSLSLSGGICHMKELSLENVCIWGDTLESLLSYCPFLELLSLQASLCSHLKISGPSLNLKHLKILDCCKWSLKIEVSAPNLITLKYDGSNKDFILSNTPLLENLCMSSLYFHRFMEEAVRHPLRHFCYFYQLKTLEFDMYYKSIQHFPSEPPKLAKLEELKVATLIIPKVRMLWPIALLKASPRLKKFAVKQKSESTIVGIETVEELEKMKGVAEFTHSCLEVLEVTGYCGNLEVCEMIEGVLSIAATSLEKLIINHDETMCNRVHQRKRQEMKKVVLRRIETRLPANCRLMLN